MRSLSSIRLAIIICLTIAGSNPSFGQNTVNGHIGYGFPDLLNLGVRFQMPQVQLGLGYGFLGEFQSLSFDFYGHFGGRSEFVERKPWYFRSGVVFFREILDGYTTKLTLLPIRFGRDLNFSEKMGMQIDFGLAILLSEKNIVKDPFYTSYQTSWSSITPCLALSYFYRL